MKKTDISIFGTFHLICDQYMTNPSEVNLNRLLDIYETLRPNWVEEFNELSDKLKKGNKDNMLDDFINPTLPKEYSVKSLKVSKNRKHDALVDIMQRGRIIHLANKIAHGFEYILEGSLKEYIGNNEEMKEMRKMTPEKFAEVKQLIKQIYSANTKGIIKERAKHMLWGKYGFEYEDFDKLDLLNFPELIKAYSDAMYIKDLEIEAVSRLAYGKQEVSYGLQEDGRNGTVFVMDVQRFGQFSVHIKDPSLISQIRSRYTMPIYRKETAMLVDYVSDKSREFMEDSKADDSMDEERGITKKTSEQQKQRTRLKEEIKYLDLKKGEKHEIAVKGGLHRNELEEIDNAKDDEER